MSKQFESNLQIKTYKEEIEGIAVCPFGIYYANKTNSLFFIEIVYGYNELTHKHQHNQLKNHQLN